MGLVDVNIGWWSYGVTERELKDLDGLCWAILDVLPVRICRRL